MKIRVMICVGLLGLVLAAASADDGAIPIFEPTTLSVAGHYIVTRNIQASGPVLTIPASALAVTIDLNGFFLMRTDNAGPVVDTVPDGDSRPNVSIRNGEIAGGLNGIDGGDGVSLTDVGFYDQFGDGVELSSASSIFIRNCIVANSRGRGIVLSGGNSIRVIGTVVREPQGTGISITGDGVLLRDSFVESAQGLGISIVGNGHRISEIIVRGTQPGAGSGHGILVDGSRNLIEGALVVQNSGFGLFFSTGSADNVYRGNVARGNSGSACTGTASGGDFCDQGVGNTSGADNFMPDEM